MSPGAPSAASNEMLVSTKPYVEPTRILHRTPWTPPVAVKGQGIYITLQDGTTVIDAIGGAAVTAIGSGHTVVQKAIKDQVDRLACRSHSLTLKCDARLNNHVTMIHRCLQHATVQ